MRACVFPPDVEDGPLSRCHEEPLVLAEHTLGFFTHRVVEQSGSPHWHIVPQTLPCHPVAHHQQA